MGCVVFRCVLLCFVVLRCDFWCIVVLLLFFECWAAQPGRGRQGASKGRGNTSHTRSGTAAVANGPGPRRYQLPAAQAPIFPDRAALLAYEAALRVADAVQRALEERDHGAAEAAAAPAVEALLRGGEGEGGAGLGPSGPGPGGSEQPASDGAMRAAFAGQFTPATVWVGVATVAVSLLERRRDYAGAIAVLRALLSGAPGAQLRSPFTVPAPHVHQRGLNARGLCRDKLLRLSPRAGSACPGRRGGWWVRLAIDLEHLKRKDESLEAAEARHTPLRMND